MAANEDLRSHIVGGAQHLIHAFHRVEGNRRPKVNDLHAITSHQKDVLGFQISVRYLALVAVYYRL